ncbi:MAG: ATP-binding protein [Bryobacteraceae bacterium]|jgi:two-component system sensor histidine kinase KdpD
MRPRTPARIVFRIAAIGLSITTPAIFNHYTIHANSVTASLTFLLIVLAAATLWGLPEAMLASACSMLCLDYFFFPPVPSFGIDDPQNWVAWCTFLITSFVVSDLSRRLRKRALEATNRQHEIERMYALSCSLMPGETARTLAERIPERIMEIFSCPGVAFFDRVSGETYSAGGSADIDDRSLAQAAGIEHMPGSAMEGGAFVPVSLGAEAIGSLGFSGASISPPTMQSIANLVAMAMDRARKQEAAGRAEAARRHQEFKSMTLDALAHEFQTPLTSIRAGIAAMLAESPGCDQQEWLEIMDEESGRLTAMMAEAIQMARIEAGHVDLDKQAHTVEDLVYSALEKTIADGTQIEIDLAGSLPAVSVDAGLIRLVIRQLTGNALKYSRPGDAITVRAHAAQDGVVISVSDSGPGISTEEQRRIFEKYYRGKHGRGHPTGMGMGLPIARQIVEAHDGQIWVESQPGAGATFFFTLPAAREEVTA